VVVVVAWGSMPDDELERRRQYMDRLWKSFTYQRPPVVRAWFHSLFARRGARLVALTRKRRLAGGGRVLRHHARAGTQAPRLQDVKPALLVVEASRAKGRRPCMRLANVSIAVPFLMRRICSPPRASHVALPQRSQLKCLHTSSGSGNERANERANRGSGARD
jgi:hypothetical protein